MCSLCPYRHWFVRLRRLPGVRCAPMRVPTALQGSFDDRYVEIDDRDFTRLKSGITFHEISFSDFRTSILRTTPEAVTRHIGRSLHNGRSCLAGRQWLSSHLLRGADAVANRLDSWPYEARRLLLFGRQQRGFFMRPGWWRERNRCSGSTVARVGHDCSRVLPISRPASVTLPSRDCISRGPSGHAISGDLVRL